MIEVTDVVRDVEAITAMRTLIEYCKQHGRCKDCVLKTKTASFCVCGMGSYPLSWEIIFAKEIEKKK